MPKKEKEEKKIDTTVMIAVIGLIGTLITALLTSPVILKLLDQKTATAVPATQVAVASPTTLVSSPTVVSPTDTLVPPTNTLVPPTATTVPPTIAGQGKLIFDENFDDNNASGFAFQVGNWKVVKEKGNPVLQGDAHGVVNDVATALFGPNDFTNGIIEAKIMLKSPETVYIGFRGNQSDAYLLSIAANSGNIVMGMNGASTQWNMQPFTNGERGFSFAQDVWYTAHLEVHAETMTLWIDGNLIMTVTDNRLSHGIVFFGIDPEGTALFDDVKIWQTQ